MSVRMSATHLYCFQVGMLVHLAHRVHVDVGIGMRELVVSHCALLPSVT